MARTQSSFLKQHRKRMTWLAALAAVAAACGWWYTAERSAWRLHATLPSQGGFVLNLSVSPDGSYLAVGAFGNQVALWDMTQQRVAGTIDSEWIDQSFAFSPDSRLLAIGAWEGVQVWNLDKLELRIKLSVPDDVLTVDSVAFSPNGTILAGACDDGKIRLWDVATGSEIETLESSNDDFDSIAYSPDGRMLAAGSWDGELAVWTLATREQRLLISDEDEMGSVGSVAFSPDGKTLAAAVYSPGVVLWDVATWAKLATADLPKGGTFVVFSQDGSLLVAGTKPTRRGFWERLPFPERFTSKLGFDIRPYGTLHVYDAATLREIASFPTHHQCVNSAAFSPDGRTLVTGGDDTSIKIWEIPD